MGLFLGEERLVDSLFSLHQLRYYILWLTLIIRNGRLLLLEFSSKDFNSLTNIIFTKQNLPLKLILHLLISKIHLNILF